jgi:hypothetical protein
MLMRPDYQHRLVIPFLLLFAGILVSPLTAQSKAIPPAARKSLLNAMKQGLRQMVVAQSTYYEVHGTFTNSPPNGVAKASATYHFELSGADPSGWTGVTTSTADATLHCGLYVGRAVAPNAAVVAPTVPACWSVNADGSMTTE